MRAAAVIPLLIGIVASAHAGGPVPVEYLLAEKLPGGTARWTWTGSPSAVGYDIAGDALPASDVDGAVCRTGEDADTTDTIFDDPALPPPGSGDYVLIAAIYGGPSWLAACAPSAAYFCVRDATGDSFVLKLEDEAKIAHARDVVRNIETEVVHVGAMTTGGPVPWNPHWQFHIPPDAVYFFDQSIEVCDASIAYVDSGGPPRGNWCPWTSDIFFELSPFENWPGPTPEPIYCGPAM